ncbi:hypothetical protein [Streptomyces sp. NPDC053755]|uniref:hypothetical protein n=1 Tax=Streptomyces sp. NPDC053755 TaxID=3155815 RepID=UPI00342D911C
MTDTAEIPEQAALLVKELGHCVRLIDLECEDLEKGSDEAEGVADQLERYARVLDILVKGLRGE